jgi:hypothetical protein
MQTRRFELLAEGLMSRPIVAVTSKRLDGLLVVVSVKRELNLRDTHPAWTVSSELVSVEKFPASRAPCWSSHVPQNAS